MASFNLIKVKSYIIYFKARIKLGSINNKDNKVILTCLTI